MVTDFCFLPPREPPDIGLVPPQRFIRDDLKRAHQKFALQKAAAAKREGASVAAYLDGDSVTWIPGPVPISHPPDGSSLVVGNSPHSITQGDREWANTTETVESDVSVSLRLPEAHDQVKTAPTKQRLLTELRLPVLPAASTYTTTLKEPTPRGSGRDRGPAGPGRAPLPATLVKMRERFPTLAQFASHLSSSPRQISNDTIEVSEGDDSQSLDDHRDKRQRRGPMVLPLEGLRVLFLSEDLRIPHTSITTMMKNLHERGAVLHERLIFHSEDPNEYTTHIVATKVDKRDMTLRRVLKLLELENEEALYLDTISSVSCLRRPLVVKQQWASDAIRHGKIAEDLYIVNSKASAQTRPTHPRARSDRRSMKQAVGSVSDQTQGCPQGSLEEGLKLDSAAVEIPLPVAAVQVPPVLHTPTPQSLPIEGPVPTSDLQEVEWEDLAEEISEAERGGGKEGSPPRQTSKNGFIIRPERKSLGSDTDGEQAARRLNDLAKQSEHRQKRYLEEQTWACQRKSVYGGSKAACVDNQRIVDILGELAEDYDRVGDYWRLSTCRKVLGIVRNTIYRLDTFAKCRAIRGVGDSMARKIVEIYQTGQLERLNRRTPADRACVLFARCHGIGPAEAGRFVNLGARELKDLQPGNPFGIRLNRQQELGLKYYEDLCLRMPREEAGAIHALIEERGKQLDPKATFSIMGSYRRGQPDCGDIDILVSRDTDDGHDHSGLVRRLVHQLFKDGLLKHALSEPENWDALDAKWLGLCSLRGQKMRRIDFLGVPHDEMAAALIYFTGNDIFNRSLRLKARKLGYSLNQRGLSKNVFRDPHSKLKVTDGEMMKFKTEEEIFDFLGVRWRPPTERLP